MNKSLPTAKEVGGKAAELFKLAAHGFNIPPTVVSPANLAAAVEEIGFPIAVRSSATLEDGVATSFAGQFESYLELNTLAEVEEAIEKCKASANVPSVVEYCRKNNVDLTQLRMEVIIQRMIEPELAGVAFTVNPVTGKEEVVIEACEGLADELLLGRKASLPDTHPLMKKYRKLIESTAKKIQCAFGRPQDLEFAIEDGELFLLQARPITRINFSPDVGEWTNADFRDGGVSSTVCTPLMWSLYDHIWKDALPDFFKDIRLLKEPFQAGKIFFGRPYWNLGAVKQCMAKVPGFKESDFDEDLSVEVKYEGNGIETPVNIFTILKILPTAFAMKKVFKSHEALCNNFLKNEFSEIEKRIEQLPVDNLDEGFKQLIQADFKYVETSYFRTIFCASLAKLEFTDAFPDADYTRLVAGLPAMKHTAPTRAMKAMAARGETDIAPLLLEFRHHSRKELDIRVPRWDQDPEFVQSIYDQFKDHHEVGESAVEIFEIAQAEYLAILPKNKHKEFHKKLGLLRRFLWLREEMRDCSTKTYYHIRRYLMALADHHNWGDDIFFMTLEDIFTLDTSKVEENQAYYESYRDFKAPNEIGSRFGYEKKIATGALVGIGASQGEVTGIARIARSVEETTRIARGEILICHFTDPGWTPVLDRVAAVVTETGGLLSHAAVICREYGIPAVLGVPNVTERILDGQRITVYGTGSVEIIG